MGDVVFVMQHCQGVVLDVDSRLFRRRKLHGIGACPIVALGGDVGARVCLTACGKHENKIANETGRRRETNPESFCLQVMMFYFCL